MTRTPHRLLRRPTSPRVTRTVVRSCVVAAMTLLGLGLGAGEGRAGSAAKEAPPNLTELVRQVHQASLVEIWVGQRAQQVSTNAAVRWVGQNLVTEHAFLDEEVEKVAGAYGIKLPPEPTQWQQAGARKTARESGEAFDRAFANSLFYGHERVMELIQLAKKEVAGPFVDPELKRFVQVGEDYVARHTQWLQATGLVTTASTETAARQVDTAQVVSRAKNFSNAIPAVGGMVSLAVIVLVVTTYKLRPPGRRRQRRRHGRRGARDGPGPAAPGSGAPDGARSDDAGTGGTGAQAGGSTTPTGPPPADPGTTAGTGTDSLPVPVPARAGPNHGEPAQGVRPHRYLEPGQGTARPAASLTPVRVPGPAGASASPPPAATPNTADQSGPEPVR